MSSDDLSSEFTLDPTLNVSMVDITLEKDSHKSIKSIKLKKNNELLRDVSNLKCEGGLHQIKFDPPFALDPEDRISVSANCTWPVPLRGMKEADIPIEINLRDPECMRDDQLMKLYRTKARKIEVVVTGYHSFLSTTTSIIQSCERFRLLIIGNSGVGKSSLIHKVFGVGSVHASETHRGATDIDQEYFSMTNDRFVVHDSLGFESGDDQNMEIVKDFVARRMAMPQLKDQLHAVWLCVETPFAGGRLLEGGAERFLQRRGEILGEVPLVVVLTKMDQLDIQLEVEPPKDEDVKQYKSKYLDMHCIGPLHEAAGSDITHVAVSVKDGYAESLSDLVGATDKNMTKYHIGEAPRVVVSIAQRVSVKEKIESSIAVGRKKYWNMLFKSSIVHGRTLQEYLQVIRKDIITIWNFNDPCKCLMDDNIIEALLRTDNLGDTSLSIAAPFVGLLTSALELSKSLSQSGDITLSVIGAIASITFSGAELTYAAYQKAHRRVKSDVKIFMAYIVDLICVMQAVSLFTSGGCDTVSSETVSLAMKAYEEPRKSVHRIVEAFDGKLGCDSVLDKIEKLVWRYSISDREVEGSRQKIGKVLLRSST